MLEDAASQAARSDVQCGQRLALIATVEQHLGHSLVVGSAGGGALLSRFICLITRKMAKATITKSSSVLMKIPYFTAVFSLR